MILSGSGSVWRMLDSNPETTVWHASNEPPHLKLSMICAVIAVLVASGLSLTSWSSYQSSSSRWRYEGIGRLSTSLKRVFTRFSVSVFFHDSNPSGPTWGLTPLWDAHCGVWLRGGMHIAGSDSAVGCTLRCLTPRWDAHRGVLKNRISRPNQNWNRKYFSSFIRGPDGFE